MKTITLLTVTILGLSACLPPPTDWSGDLDNYRVAVVGDSITYSAENGRGLERANTYLTEEMNASGYAFSFSAMIGARTEDLDSVVWPNPSPQIIIINLGTNDLYNEREISDSMNNLRNHINANANSKIVLLTIPDTGVGDWEHINDQALIYNESLFDLANEFQGRVLVSDWGSVIKANPSWHDADGVHLTPEGQQAYRDYLVSIVAN